MRLLSLLLGFALVYASATVIARVPVGAAFGELWYWWALATAFSGFVGFYFMYKGAKR